MLLKALTAARDLGRLQEIARVLVRHGFGDLVHRTGIASVLQTAGRVLHLTDGPAKVNLPPAERVRRALEELGPTFVKLGQVLATRRDLLPPEWILEFGKLHEHVSAVPFSELREQLTEDLGGPPSACFSRLDEEPLAAGSIAQVHRAQLDDGRDVVLKIRRPGIADEVRADLRLVAHVAELIEQKVPELGRYQPKRVVRQFSNVMQAELDFRIESKNQRIITEQLAEHPRVVVPTIEDGFTRERLMVQQYIEGVSAAAWLQDATTAEIDGEALAQIGADAVLDMVFVHGLYHADPHPGNVMFLSEGRLGLLDFGMVGRLSERRRRELAGLIGAVVERDDDAVVNLLLDWAAGGDPDVEMLAADCGAFLDRYHGVALGELDVTGMLRDITEIVRQNDLSLPSDVTLLIKVLVTLEGLGASLDPAFDMAAHVEPAAREMIRQLRAPRATVRRGVRDLRTLLLELPREIRSIVRKSRRGGFKVEFELKHLEEFTETIDRSANRITIGLITSALIVGTAIALTVDSGPQILGVPALGLLGFVTSLLIGAGLLLSMLRAGRHW